jgi:8-oxo-dGTP pyrophosphatase MutT (NUDIX family)
MTSSFLKNLKDSSVLVPLIFINDEVHILFTIRSRFVFHHKNQICFPGGKKEKYDSDLWQTALRETKEEIGIPNQEISNLGQLPCELTPSQYRIHPFIAHVQSLDSIQYHDKEVSSHFTAPLDYFKNPNHIYFKEKFLFDQKIKIPYFTFQNHIIWGAMGRILLNLLKTYT